MIFRHFETRSVVISLVASVLSFSTSNAGGDTFGNGVTEFNIDFVTIGHIENVPDVTGSPNPAGSVPYIYRIGKYEIAEHMIDMANEAGGLGITKTVRGPNKPATGVTWFEAARFVNWLNTTTGNVPAYKFAADDFLLWQPGDTGYDPTNPFRNSLAAYFLPSTHEWYKAAYYDATNGVYYDYATGSDNLPTATPSGTVAGSAVFNQPFTVGPSDVMLAGGLSPYGTMGQGGNVFEWEETARDLSNDSIDELRGDRGDAWDNLGIDLAAAIRNNSPPSAESIKIGFRVASIAIPEPSAFGMTLLGALALTRLRHRRCSRHRRTRQGRQLAAEFLENRQMLDAGWVAALGGADNDRLWDLAADSAGNTYVVGEFSGTAAFGNKNLSSAGGADVFIAKLNSSGQVQWATRAGGTGADLGYSVAVDTGGNVVVAGHFSGSAKFGNSTLVSSGGTDAFVAKLAGNNGKFQWARKVGGGGDDRGLAVETDSSGNVLITGGLNGALFTYAAGTNSQYGGTQLFVNKYSSSGTQLWNRTVTGTFAKASFEGLAVDQAGSVYVAGAFDGTANFSTGALTSASASRDMVIGKLNSSGTWQWTELVSGTVDGDIRGAAFLAGKLYVTGAFEGTVNFDAHAVTSAGITDGFVASLDTATRSFDWAQRFGGADLDIAREVATDSLGNVHAVGSFRSTADFGPQTLVNPAPAGTSFVTTLSPTGVFVESMALAGPGSNSARNIAFDAAGNRYVGGHFEGQADFPQGTLNSAGGIDSYVTRLATTSSFAATDAAPKKRNAVLDNAIENLSFDNSNVWSASLDEELLLTLASN